MNTDIFGNDQWGSLKALLDGQQRLATRENMLMQGMANAGMSSAAASQYANLAQQKHGVPTPAWYRGVFTDDDIEALRARTRQRQQTAFANLKAAGQSVLTRDV
jgi:hypothetical protein